MKKLDDYLEEYSQSHQNQTNKKIHQFAVPAIMFSVFGLLKALPVPESWPLYLDWSVLAVFLALIFYASLKNSKIFFIMFIWLFLQMLILEFLKPHFFFLCLFIFVVGWIFQFIGHKIEGKKPSFFKDLFFLLIGPIWVEKTFFQKKSNNAKEIL
jgi:uncharacterized membrane protein YGL010W